MGTNAIIALGFLVIVGLLLIAGGMEWLVKKILGR